MNFLKKLQHSLDFWFLLITSFVFFLLRLPSFFEPYWYGDEGVYEVLGFGMRHGRLLYQGVWDNKPPLLYLMYALFDGNQPYVRVFSCLVGLVAIYFFFFLSRLLFENKKGVYLATAVFALFLALPLLEGNIANAENFMVLPTVIAYYIIVKALIRKRYTLLSFFSAGFLLGLSFLIKAVGVFDFGALFLLITYIFFAWNKKAMLNLINKLIVLSVGFFFPLFLTIGFFAYKGILKTFIQSAFLSNVGYVNYGNQLFIPQGFLILKLLILALIVLFIFFKRNSFSLLHLLIYLWVPISVFNAFFSGRPYTHYMLVLLGSMSLLVGSVFFERKWRMYCGIFCIIVIVLLAKNFWFYNKTITYYQNFAQMLAGTKTTEAYQSFFDKGVPRDYAIVQYLKTTVKPNQKAFVWTNSAQIYYLMQQLPLGRYTTAYHMTASPATLIETEDTLQKERPIFVVILPNAPSFPFTMSDYTLRIAIDGGLMYERIF